jgi:hypothetical protein
MNVIQFIIEIKKILADEPCLGKEIADNFEAEVLKKFSQVAKETAEEYCKFFVNTKHITKEFDKLIEDSFREKMEEMWNKDMEEQQKKLEFNHYGR